MLYYGGMSDTTLQPLQVKNLNILNRNEFTALNFSYERVRDSLTATVRRPDSTYSFSIAAKVLNENDKDVRSLNDAI